jgi:hypothetical protein
MPGTDIFRAEVANIEVANIDQFGIWIIQAVEKPPFPARGIVWRDSLM